MRIKEDCETLPTYGTRIKKLKGRSKGHKCDICEICKKKFKRKTKHKRRFCDTCLSDLRSKNAKKSCKVPRIKNSRGYRSREEIIKDIETITIGAITKKHKNYFSGETGTTINGIKIDKCHSKDEMIQIRDWLKCNLKKERL